MSRAKQVLNMKMRLMELARPAVRTIRPATAVLRHPVSSRWGYDRGTPIARHFIDRFMQANRGDITGTVLEIKNPRYINQFGTDVRRTDILDIDQENKQATIIADLAEAHDVSSDCYDCVIVNETLQFVYDLNSALRHVHRILKPGGVLLATVPCTCQRDRELAPVEYWRFTDVLCRRLFGDVFGPEQVHVETYGNFSTCIAGLTGLAVEELEPSMLEETSATYVQGVCIRARKSNEQPRRDTGD